MANVNVQPKKQEEIECSTSQKPAQKKKKKVDVATIEKSVAASTPDSGPVAVGEASG